jgi:hypothetical protein
MPDFPQVGGATAAQVWAYGTKELTGITGTPRTNLMGEDADLEAGTGVRKARIDEMPAFEVAVEAPILLTGPATEDILVEKTDAKQGLLDGYVDLTPMAAGDTVVIRQYMKVKAAGAYVQYAEETYAGVQTIKLLHITTKTSKTAIKVTAEHTVVAGALTLDVQFFRRLEA